MTIRPIEARIDTDRSKLTRRLLDRTMGFDGGRGRLERALQRHGDSRQALGEFKAGFWGFKAAPCGPGDSRHASFGPRGI